jgi:hypothetical protein
MRFLAERIRAAYVARREQAHAAYAESLVMDAQHLESDGIFLHTVRRYTEGVEPRWLIRARHLHDELGRYIYVLSQAHTVSLSEHILRDAEESVRASCSVNLGKSSTSTWAPLRSLVS